MITPRILVDTCVLVAVCDQRRSDVADACMAFIQDRSDLCVTSQVLREYAVVATRPIDENGLGLSMADTLQNIGEFCRFMRLLADRKSDFEALVDLLREHPVTGKRIHDANLVATALAHGLARIATLNVKDFEGLNDTVTLVDPTQG